MTTSGTGPLGDSWEMPDGASQLIQQATYCKAIQCSWISANHLTNIVSIIGPSDLVGGVALSLDAVGNGASLSISFQFRTLHTITEDHFVTLSSSYRCANFTCAGGGSFSLVAASITERHITPGGTSIATASGGFPSTLSVSANECGEELAGIPTCTGTQDWISVASAGGFEWEPLGPNDCSNDCSPAQPVTIPTAAGQFTITGCR